LQYPPLKFIGIFFLSFVFLTTNAQKPAVLDSLLRINNNYRTPDSIKVRMLSKIYGELQRGDANKKAMAQKFADSAIQIAQKLPSKISLIKLYSRLGLSHHGLGEFLEALNYYERSMEVSKLDNNKEFIASTLMSMSDIYNRLAEYAKAIEVCEQAIKIFTEINNQGGVASMYNNLCGTYIDLKDYTTAYRYALKALPIFIKEEGSKSHGVASIKILMSTILQSAGNKELQAMGIKPGEQYAKAIELLLSSLEIADKEQDHNLKADMLVGIGAAQEKLNNINEATNAYFAAIEEGNKGFDLNAVTTNYVLAGDFFLRQQQVTTGLKYLYLGLGMAKRSGILDLQRNAFLSLSKYHEKKRNYDSALQYFQLYEIVKEQIFNREKEKEITRKKMALDFGIKEQEYNFQQKLSDQTLKEKQRDLNFKNILGILLGLLALIVFIAAIIIYRSRKKTIELNKTVEAQKKSLEELVQVKDKVFSIVGHDMRTPINSLMSFVQLLEYGDIPKDMLAKYALELGNNLRFTSSLMENLLYWAGSQMQGFKPRFEEVNLNNILVTVIEHLQAATRQKNIQINHSIEPQQLIWTDKEMLALILRNLLSNAIKFSFSDSVIHVDCNLINREVLITITDVGTGLSNVKLAEINSETALAIDSSYGTKNEKGTGLGLLLSKTFAVMLRGKISAQKNDPSGTKFILMLPINTI